VLADGVLHEGGRLMNRRRQRACRRIRLLPDVDRARLELHGGDATAETRPEERLAHAAIRRDTHDIHDAQLINRDEVVSLLFNLADAVAELRAIRALLEDDDDDGEVQEDLE